MYPRSFFSFIGPAAFFFSLLVGTGSRGFAAEKAALPAISPSDEVNMLIGSGGGGTEYGGTMPFVKTPFGMTDWVAQTRQNKISAMSYAYEDTSISGFIGTHQPAPWMGDFGYVTLMPGVDAVKPTPEARKLPFTHAGEKTTPYSYSVAMDAGANRVIKAQITATSRCALLRFTFPRNSASNFIVEATRPQIKGTIKVDAKAREIVGYNPDRMDSMYGPMRLPNFKGYFVVQFHKAIAGCGTYSGEALSANQAEFTGKGAGAYVTFPTSENEVVDVRVGTSFISIEQSRDNLRREIPDWNFDAVSRNLKTTWDRKLGIASVEGASDDQRNIFATAIYHSLVYPREFSEYGRYYSAFDDTVHRGQSYTSFSLWDTFRAENSTITLFAPERVDGMVQALLQNYQEGGWLPKWPNPSYTNIMIATPADSIVAEAINKGFKGFNTELAYKAVYQDAIVPPTGDTHHSFYDREQHTPYEARNGLTYFKQLGFFPTDKTSEAASSMLEDAYDDWCVAQVAKATGRTKEYQFFINRCQAYKTLFNPATGFMQAKNADGSWANPDAGWTEGSKWNYTWAVMQDMPGLVQLMGGPDKFNAKLDEHFMGGHNAHSNEPSHHYAYLYDYSGTPWKTQQRVRQIAADAYANTPTGIQGNDDCGQMSSWYVFAALGFYPVNPASGDYMIGSPLFTRVVLNLPNGKRFTISAPSNSEKNIYIQAATLNGHPLAIPVITYADIQRGGELSLQMGDSPSKWGSQWQPAPLPKYPSQLTEADFPLPAAPPRSPVGTQVVAPTPLQTFDGQSDWLRDRLTALPTEATAPWTINLFVRPDKAPDDLTLLGGFGSARDDPGTQRYIGRIHGGIHFWGASIDIDSGVPFDVGHWQMLTATFDGNTITLYKNGVPIKTATAVFNDASPEVHLSPDGIWPEGHQFQGRVQGFAIWNSALSPSAIHDLMKSLPKE